MINIGQIFSVTLLDNILFSLSLIIYFSLYYCNKKNGQTKMKMVGLHHLGVKRGTQDEYGVDCYHKRS